MPRRAWLLILIVFTLTGLGMVVLMSAGQVSGATGASYFERQARWVVVAIGVGTACFLLGVRRVHAFWWLAGLAGLAGLVAVLIPGIGIEVNGARRWIAVGGQRFQPGEFSKLSFLLVYCAFLAANVRRMTAFREGFVFPLVIIAVYCGLLLMEPDLGTSVLYAAVGGALLLAAGARVSWLLMAIGLAVAAFIALVIDNPMRMSRIMTFADPMAHRLEGGYQLWQGIIGFGAGGLFGVGPGNGRQHLSFLPEAHTDFIFAVLGEELGLVSTAGVVLLFTVFAVVVLAQLRRAPDAFQFFFVLGCLLFILGQAAINMAVVTGMIPTKGMSLPFLSYGGSNLVVVYAMVGFILSAFRLWERPVLTQAREI